MNVRVIYCKWQLCVCYLHPRVWRRDGALTGLQSPPGSHPSWSQIHPEQSLHLQQTHFSFLIFFLQQNVSYHSFHIKQTYRTPPTPDSCWCPLKAKEFWGETQEDYFPAGTDASSKGLPWNCNNSIRSQTTSARITTELKRWKLKIYELKALKWHPLITFTITRWSSWLQ